MTFLKSLIIAFVILTVTSNFALSQTTSNTPSNENSKTITIKVKGITCGSDLKTISANVEKLKGVGSCEVKKQGATSTFEVKYNSALVTEKEIYASIENTGGCENPEDRPYKVKR